MPPAGPEPEARLIAKELQLERSSPERTLYFHGESMRPFLVEGDEVVVEPVAWENIGIGDVITYRYLDRFPTRRVVRKSETELTLWCENWPDRTYYAPPADVLGRATARRRGEAWLRNTESEWIEARSKALRIWRRRWFRRVILPEWIDKFRRAPRKLFRLLGLLPPSPPSRPPALPP